MIKSHAGALTVGLDSTEASSSCNKLVYAHSERLNVDINIEEQHHQLLRCEKQLFNRGRYVGASWMPMVLMMLECSMSTFFGSTVYYSSDPVTLGLAVWRTAAVLKRHWLKDGGSIYARATYAHVWATKFLNPDVRIVNHILTCM